MNIQERITLETLAFKIHKVLRDKYHDQVIYLRAARTVQYHNTVNVRSHSHRIKESHSTSLH